MDLVSLIPDAEHLLPGLRRWVECESPTYDAIASSRMVDVAAADFAAAGARAERIAGPQGFGDCARVAFPHADAGRPGILVLAHLDTVHPVGTLDRLPFRREGGLCYGPGILDMKGGAFATLVAAAALRSSGEKTRLPLHILLTSDEEIGSPGTRDLIMEEARRHRFILVPEPGRKGNSVVTGRYAIARFLLEAQGRPSHAGLALADGRSAISLMARELLNIEAMTTDAYTFSVGVIEGGRWVNCVPTHCRAEVLSMAKSQSDLDECIKKLLALSRQEADGERFTVSLGEVRPFWQANAGTLQLYEIARGIARELGLDLRHTSAGGGSDGNFTGAAGIPTLDGLGPLGGGQHTLAEHIDVESLCQCTRLLAALMMQLA